MNMMKKEDSIRSMKSTKSIRSTKSQKTYNSSLTIVPDIITILLAACEKLIPNYSIQVKKEVRKEEYMKRLKKLEKAKYKKISVVVPFESFSEAQVIKLDTKIDGPDLVFDPNSILITAFYDGMQNLTELMISNESDLPCGLFQVFGYILPSYENVTKITINESHINPYILHELSKIICVTSVTEICLDGSSLLEGNFHIILDNNKSCLKSLSLARCRINDEMCKEIATTLQFSAPAEQSLLLLNLSSNHISDEGAKHLGEALRSNRHLRYLNLSDNRIGDDGTFCILNSLIEFILTYDEVIIKRRTLLEYLKLKRSFISKYFTDVVTKTYDDVSLISRKMTLKSKKHPSAAYLKNKSKKEADARTIEKTAVFEDMTAKAEIFAKEMLGAFINPFAPDSVVSKESQYYCTGNFVLCYLNLSYNNLSFLSVRKLSTVLEYQKSKRKPSLPGLLKVVIEGNKLPDVCAEYQLLNELTRDARNTQHFSGRVPEVGLRRRSRTARMSTTPQNIMLH